MTVSYIFSKDFVKKVRNLICFRTKICHMIVIKQIFYNFATAFATSCP